MIASPDISLARFGRKEPKRGIHSLHTNYFQHSAVQSLGYVLFLEMHVDTFKAMSLRLSQSVRG
jgi:hypothetical protein